MANGSIGTGDGGHSSRFDFWKMHFDKMLLTGLFVFVSFVVIHLIHHKADEDSIGWATQASAGILGALLTVITGRAFQRVTETNGTKTLELSNRQLEPTPHIVETTEVKKVVTTEGQPPQPEPTNGS